MKNLYKIEKPFGLLDKETQDALRECEDVEFYGSFGEWCPTVPGDFNPSTTYRCKPKTYLPGLLYEWEGGLQPIPDHWTIQYITRDGSICGKGYDRLACNVDWGHLGEDEDIIAFVIRKCE